MTKFTIANPFVTPSKCRRLYRWH